MEQRQPAVEVVVSMANPAFWKGKRVLLTGHTGFKEAGSVCGSPKWVPG